MLAIFEFLIFSTMITIKPGPARLPLAKGRFAKNVPNVLPGLTPKASSVNFLYNLVSTTVTSSVGGLRTLLLLTETGETSGIPPEGL